MHIYSPDFRDGAELDVRFTQEADNLSPELVFAEVPEAAKSLVLIADDPDAPDPAAPRFLWLHWLAVNLPADCPGLPEGVAEMPAGTLVAVNDSGVRGWSGPRPPVGVHRYYFRLFALDCRLELPADFTRAEAERAMHGHVIAAAQTMGTYILSTNRR